MITSILVVTGIIALILCQLDAVQAFAPRLTAQQHSAPSTAVIPHHHFSSSTTTLLSLSSSKWDNLVDEDDDENRITISFPDMKYLERNVMRQHQHFCDIRQAGGKELTNDVYAREPSSNVYWFVGKVARVSDIPLEQAVARQWSLIEQHAANLRPIELYPHRGQLELYTAPGDSELEVAYNRPSIVFEKWNKDAISDNNVKIKNIMVGFSGEVYEQNEEGFRTWRTEEGLPANPEINAGSEARAPTDEEMAELQDKLEGQDLNALYQEQQRRQGKKVSE